MNGLRFKQHNYWRKDCYFYQESLNENLVRIHFRSFDSAQFVIIDGGSALLLQLTYIQRLRAQMLIPVKSQRKNQQTFFNINNSNLLIGFQRPSKLLQQ
ncbi:unnamed protein product [Paramecium sonneborni]|uniref:Uncharacterized protein n=1 Tax=Paramecium sonneborni TaxID=65129 RepID=A0A8S1PI51_9CILI|nr:unnamed protein product [Paramecium sonneborni]